MVSMDNILVHNSRDKGSANHPKTTAHGHEPDNDLLSYNASKNSRDNKLIENAKSTSTANPYKYPGQVTKPRNVQEQILWKKVIREPQNGRTLPGMNNDSRFPKDAGFQKMEAIMRGNDGRNVVIHYQYNKKTGKAYDIKIVSKY